jgi:hypothetical protein
MVNSNGSAREGQTKELSELLELTRFVYENASVEHRSAFRAMLELLARQQGKTEGEIQEELKAKWRRGIRIVDGNRPKGA